LSTTPVPSASFPPRPCVPPCSIVRVLCFRSLPLLLRRCCGSPRRNGPTAPANRAAHPHSTPPRPWARARVWPGSFQSTLHRHGVGWRREAIGPTDEPRVSRTEPMPTFAEDPKEQKWVPYTPSPVVMLSFSRLVRGNRQIPHLPAVSRASVPNRTRYVWARSNRTPQVGSINRRTARLRR
jgi:hypothetical protein